MPYLSLLLALALIAGLAGGVVIDRPPALAAALLLAASWTFAVLAFRTSWPRVFLAAVTCAIATAGLLLGQHAVDRALHTPLRTALEQAVGGFALDAPDDGRLDEPVVIEGRLRADAALTDNGVSLSVEVDRLFLEGLERTVGGGVSLGVGGAPNPGAIAAWRKGTRIRAPALLRRPARYLNSALGDQERALARRGITLIGTIKSAALVDVLSAPWWWDRVSAAVRGRTRVALARHVGVHASTSVAIATAILIGDRSGLAPDLERRLQEAGTYHVIAISGGNIAILVGTMLVALGGLGLRGRLALLLTMTGVVAYAFVVEGGASVARATLMAVIYLAVRTIDQRTAAANAIGLAAAAILLVTPLAVADVGFWLTFGASAAILIGATHVPGGSRGWLRVAWSVLAATMAAEVALAPVSALVFQRATIAGLGLNFIALPAMTLVQLAATAVVVLDPVSQLLANWASVAVHIGCVALLESARGVDYAPWLTWRVPSPSPWLVAAYYAMLAGLLWMRPSSRRWSSRACGVVAALLFVWILGVPDARVRAHGDGRLHVSMIDVGQGDAALVTFPNGRTLLVDTGGASLNGTFDIGDRVVGPVLRAGGLLTLDYLAITHGDPDHLGGALSLVRDFAPHEIWWGVPVPRHEPTDRLRAESDRQRTGWRTLQRGDRFEIGGVDLLVHHPPPPDWERQRVRNDDSLVIELRFGDVSMLFTGDIGTAVEQSLLPLLDPRPLVVLKVPHHGSATSSSAAFLERLQPAAALIGVGRANPYGHPVRAVLDRLHGVGTRVFRTDRDGQTDVTTDGHALYVETFTGTRWRSKASHEGTKTRKE